MKPQRRKNTKTKLRQHRLEEDAEKFFNPFQAVENPDWLVGAY